MGKDRKFILTLEESGINYVSIFNSSIDLICLLPIVELRATNISPISLAFILERCLIFDSLVYFRVCLWQNFFFYGKLKGRNLCLGRGI